MLSSNATPSTPECGEPYVMKNGIPILPSRGEVVSTGHIQRIMEEEGI